MWVLHVILSCLGLAAGFYEETLAGFPFPNLNSSWAVAGMHRFLLPPYLQEVFVTCSSRFSSLTSAGKLVCWGNVAGAFASRLWKPFLNGLLGFFASDEDSVLSVALPLQTAAADSICGFAFSCIVGTRCTCASSRTGNQQQLAVSRSSSVMRSEKFSSGCSRMPLWYLFIY